MSYTLFYKKGACSLAVHAVLLELKQEFVLKSYYAENGTDKNPELLALNPRGSVPALIDHGEDFSMFEGAAILTYLCDKHASLLLPKTGRERAKTLQWLMFANSSLHPAYSKIFGLLGKYGELGLSDEAKDILLENAGKNVQALWDQFESHLQETGFDYAAGNEISVADFLLTNIANWSAFIPVDITLGDATKAFLKRVSMRDSLEKALKSEGVPYKAV